MKKSKSQEINWLAQGHTVKWNRALNMCLFLGCQKVLVGLGNPSMFLLSQHSFTLRNAPVWMINYMVTLFIVLPNSSPILPLLTFKCGAVNQKPRRLGMEQAWVSSVCSYRALLRLLSLLIALEYPFHPKDHSSLVHTQTQKKLKFLCHRLPRLLCHWMLYSQKWIFT